MSTTQLARLPRALALALRPLPLAPLSLALSQLAQRMVNAHPGLMRRMGEHAGARFLLDPTDLPFTLEVCVDGATVRAHRRTAPPDYNARIAGPLSAFLAMMHGAEDGDALFFSRDLVIEGDTGAVLALRNAIDDSELDLTEEIAAIGGPAGGILRRALQRAEARTGLSLHRIDPFGANI
ncbi:SCP2 sterol-binding domain-containing protein [Thioclava sp. A2]|uniref:ubiquinone anaerobic biosynthesis accessory factor UbiT n=1 Tax=Thioclava sp. FCG-A2 TaxID=3080562 RepID=UPI0029551C99|nr:SCP2 sterol-binding domain-containing protein [Thioclava sp. A2]MDV7269331.1 SCP2 sterol-binding domain-containing protein [Thioclava sp. A2]